MHRRDFFHSRILCHPRRTRAAIQSSAGLHSSRPRSGQPREARAGVCEKGHFLDEGSPLSTPRLDDARRDGPQGAAAAAIDFGPPGPPRGARPARAPARPFGTRRGDARAPGVARETYERRAIEEWIAKGPRKGEVPISPLTGEPLKDTTLRPNFLARALSSGLPAKM